MENNKVLVGILIIAIIAVALYLGVGSSGATVSAIGESEIKAQPDLVKVYFNIQTNGNSSKEAKDSLDEISESVQIALLRLKLDREKIQMQSYNIYQEYDWSNGQRKEKGFVASQQIVVETEDFDLTVGIVDAGVDNGALVNWINFELSEERQKEYKKKALEEAGKDAKAKAEATASGLGKSLGRLVSVQSQDFRYGPYRYFETGVAESGTMNTATVKEAALNIAPRDVSVNAVISVQYKLRAF
jgi:uncharacterized protein